MTETSMFWNTNDVGDGADSGFSASVIAGWMITIFARGSSGILKRVGNELAVSGAASPLEVDNGYALVDGLFYENSTALELTVATPAVGTTGGRVILQADWSAQTVRAAILLNDDGDADLPDLTQTPGTLYEISLASFQIETDGDITTLVNTTERAAMANSFRPDQIILAGTSVIGKNDSGSGAGEAITASADGKPLARNSGELQFGEIAEGGIADDAVTAEKLADDLEVVAAQIADDAVGNSELASDAVDDTKVGNRVPQFYRRQGGSASEWNSPGTTEYTPGAVRMIAGCCQLIIPNGSYYGYEILTPPLNLTRPLILVTVRSEDYNSNLYMCRAYTYSDGTFYIFISRPNTSGQVWVQVNWLMIGPE